MFFDTKLTQIFKWRIRTLDSAPDRPRGGDTVRGQERWRWIPEKSDHSISGTEREFWLENFRCGIWNEIVRAALLTLDITGYLFRKNEYKWRNFAANFNSRVNAYILDIFDIWTRVRWYPSTIIYLINNCYEIRKKIFSWNYS